jgi:hypothetical protein
MKQFNIYAINYNKAISYSIILLLSILTVSTCTHSEKVRLALKKNIEISNLKAEKYANHINTLNDSLEVLNRIKQREKIKIVTVVKEVERKIKEVGTMETKDLALFYQKRYEETVYITDYGIALSDTIAKMNIVEVILKDGLSQELDLTKNILLIEEKKGILKDSIISNKSLIIVEKDNVIDARIELEKELKKSLRKEKTKKNLWKITAVGILAGGGYLLVK